VLVADKIDAACERILRESGLEVERRDSIPETDLTGAIAPFAGLLVRSRIRIRREHIEAAAALRIIGRAGAGVDNIDVAAATERGIVVVNAPGSNTESVAEHVFALLFAACRHVDRAAQAFREGRWDRHVFMGTELKGKTIGIVGLGKVGQQVAELAKALRMSVIANSPRTMKMPSRRKRFEEQGIELTDLLDLLRKADVVSLHCPLSTDTEGMIGEKELRLMKKSAILINTSRGPVVDEAALHRALTEGWIRFACLDVFDVEPPPPDWPLRKLPNLIPTPHLAASTAEAQVRAAEEIARELVGFFRSGEAPNAVNRP
jgi:D-3-phosphoglycerate dehydrogenase